ncbi:MAG: methyltransferase domain-containing protein [Planctomycetota bacterium]
MREATAGQGLIGKGLTGQRMLVAIANHGTKNDGFAKRVIDEYRAMPCDVDIVILSNVEKDWGPDVEVRVGCPTKDPWSLPFGHRQLFADRRDDYDLFVYSEDDTLLEARHVEAFLAADAVLPEGMIAGFLRQEETEAGERFICSAHSFFRWDPGSTVSYGGVRFARFTNDHAACYVLTRDHLRRAIDSGGFVVGPHQSRYDLLVTAATDPYTQCGLQRVICISRFDDYVLPHLPNVYLGSLGVARETFERQVEALHRIADGELPAEPLLEPETRAFHARWSKFFYEPLDEQLVERVEGQGLSILSVGCGSGETERALASAGHAVTAVSLDAVIATAVDASEIELHFGALERVIEALEGRSFDAIYVSNLLHICRDPSAFLRAFQPLLRAGGSWYVRSHNFGFIRTLQGRLMGRKGYEGLGDYEAAGLHTLGPRSIRRLLASLGATRSSVDTWVPPRFARIDRLTLHLFSERMSRSVLVAAVQSGR